MADLSGFTIPFLGTKNKKKPSSTSPKEEGSAFSINQAKDITEYVGSIDENIAWFTNQLTAFEKKQFEESKKRIEEQRLKDKKFLETQDDPKTTKLRKKVTELWAKSLKPFLFSFGKLVKNFLSPSKVTGLLGFLFAIFIALKLGMLQTLLPAIIDLAGTFFKFIIKEIPNIVKFLLKTIIEYTPKIIGGLLNVAQDIIGDLGTDLGSTIINAFYDKKEAAILIKRMEEDAARSKKLRSEFGFIGGNVLNDQYKMLRLLDETAKQQYKQGKISKEAYDLRNKDIELRKKEIEATKEAYKKGIFAGLGQTFKNMINESKRSLEILFQEKILDPIKAIKYFITNLVMPTVKKFFSTTVIGPLNFIKNLITKMIIPAVENLFSTVILEPLKFIKNIIVKISSSIKNFFSLILNGFKNALFAVGDFFRAIPATISSMGSKMGDAIKGMFTGMGNKIASIMDFSKIKNAFSKITTWFEDTINGIQYWFASSFIGQKLGMKTYGATSAKEYGTLSKVATISESGESRERMAKYISGGMKDKSLVSIDEQTLAESIVKAQGGNLTKAAETARSQKSIETLTTGQNKMSFIKTFEINKNTNTESSS